MSVRWYVIRTNIKSEEKAERNLRVAGFFTYAPFGRTERFSRRKKIFREISYRMMPRYLFVELPDDVPWYALRACEGVESVLGSDGPCPLNKEETNALLRLIAAERNLDFDETRAGKLRRREIGRTKKETTRLRFPPGSRVLIKQGPFTSLTAEVTNINGRGAINAMVSLFGRLSDIELPAEWVEVVDVPREAA